MPLETNSSHTCFMIRVYHFNTAFDYVVNMEFLSVNKLTTKFVFVKMLRKRERVNHKDCGEILRFHINTVCPHAPRLRLPFPFISSAVLILH